MSLVDYSEKGSVAVISLNRPPVNALNEELVAGVVDAISRAGSPELRAVVITGSRVFAAGADIKRFVDVFDSDASEPQASGLGDAIRALELLPKPVIAAINGFALGGGLELALGADFRYLGHSARVGQPEVVLGLIPGAGGTLRLQRVVGYQRAKDLVLSGRQVGADEALAIGLADKVVADDDLLSVAMMDATEWAEGPTAAYAAAKKALNDGRALPLDGALELERNLFNNLFATEDAKAGIVAFVEKTSPVFKGN